MAEHTENPPEGLWESIGLKAPVTEGVPAGGSAAERGGNRWAPLWWSFAGVALAGLATVMIVRTPGTSNLGPTAASEVIALNESEEPETLDVTEDSGVDGVAPDASIEASDASQRSTGESSAIEGGAGSAASSGHSGTNGRVQQKPVNSSAVAIATDASSQGLENAGQEAPDATVAATGETVVSEADGAGKELEQDASGKSAAPSEKEERGSVRQQPQQRYNYPTYSTPVNRVRKNKVDSRLTASLLGGNSFGSSNISLENYGMPSVADGGTKRLAAVNRNKFTETNISYRQDYQVGLLVNYTLSERWAVETGLQLTGLSSRTSSMTGGVLLDTSERLMYLGVPVHFVFYPWISKYVSFYLTAGPAAEWGIVRTTNVTETIGEYQGTSDMSRDHPGDWTFSAFGGAGFQFHPWKSGAFFVQPGVSWHFYDTGSPVSYYTERPVAFQFAAGYKIIF